MSSLTVFRSGRALSLRALSRQLAKGSTIAASEKLSRGVLVEEETMPGYIAKSFYPAKPGELLHGRYRILSKLGFGSSSTVWLGKDTSRWFWQSNRYITLKIVVSDAENGANHEAAISKHLGTNPTHKGFRFVRGVIDHFEILGPDGKHQCLVYEPMRETMTLLQRRLKNGKIPVFLLKEYMMHLLLALDYLHSECHIIHTDIKQDNILMGFEDPSVLEDYVRSKAKTAMLRKVYRDRSIYLSHYNFGPLKSFLMLPKLGDFGLAYRGDGAEPLRLPIQPPVYQAPEVLLGIPWSYSADIWNLGVLIWNLLENQDLFRNITSPDGRYDARKHLAEMIALFGPPPRELLEREREWSAVKYPSPPPHDAKGRCYWTARKLYGGPFFSPEGEFLYRDLIPLDLHLADLVPSLGEEEKWQCLEFVGNMLQWLPENRKSAKELLAHPWLAD